MHITDNNLLWKEDEKSCSQHFILNINEKKFFANAGYGGVFGKTTINYKAL